MSSVEDLSAGLIGCGDVAHRYAAAMTGAVDGLRLDAVFDLDHEKGRRFANRYGTRVVPSLERFLRRRFDLVCVCTPNHTHSGIAEACLKAKYHVLVEHPMALGVAEGQHICSLISECGPQLFVMRQRRFLRSVQLLKAALQQGRLGEIPRARAAMVWNRPREYFAAQAWRLLSKNGGVVNNQASHFLDILLYLFGKPLAVDGVVGNIRHDIPVEDSAMGTIVFGGGPVVEFACTTAAPSGHNWSQLTLTGTAGRVVLGGKAWETVTTPPGTSICDLGSSLESPLPGDHVGYLQRVVWRLSGRAVQVVDAPEGMRAVRLINDIYRRFKRDSVGLKNYFSPLFDGLRR